MSITTKKTTITVRATINAPVEKVWTLWTDPQHIIRWNNASDDWHTPKAENDLRVGGRFLSRMESRDGSQGFNFTGVYNKIVYQKQIEYTMDDGRKVLINFVSDENTTKVTEMFEAEQTNSIELQESGWKSILNNFKKYVETSNKPESMHFKIVVDAKVEKVYKTMLDEKTYAEWTSEFNPTSHYKGSWEKGSKIIFLGTDPNGKTGGMVSRIKENIPDKFVCIEHLGIFQNGMEITSGPEVEPWAGALESYTFNNDSGKTILSIKMETEKEINEEFKSYFLQTWPKALNKLKTICER